VGEKQYFLYLPLLTVSSVGQNETKFSLLI